MHVASISYLGVALDEGLDADERHRWEMFSEAKLPRFANRLGGSPVFLDVGHVDSHATDVLRISARSREHRQYIVESSKNWLARSRIRSKVPSCLSHPTWPAMSKAKRSPRPRESNAVRVAARPRPFGRIDGAKCMNVSQSFALHRLRSPGHGVPRASSARRRMNDVRDFVRLDQSVFPGGESSARAQSVHWINWKRPVRCAIRSTAPICHRGGDESRAGPALMVTPERAISVAMARTRPTTACFEAQYADV